MDCTVVTKYLYDIYALCAVSSPASHRGGPGLIPRGLWDLQWTQWRWDGLR